jgi:hypothetical protein
MEEIAKKILALTHSELVEFATELVEMQQGAKDDGWAWKPNQVHGQYGLVEMLHSWADSKA